MKRINLRSRNILLAFFLLFAGGIALNGCDVDHTLDAHLYSKIYISKARNNPIKSTLTKGVDSGETVQFRAVYGGPGKPSHDITIHFAIDTSLVDSFNIQHFSAYTAMPEGNYTLSGNTTVIPAGQTYSALVKMKIKRKSGTSDGQYLLPLTITKNSGGISLNEDLKTAYFLIHFNSLTPVNTPVIITGFLADPSGSDAPEPGHQSWDWKHPQHVGYEYIQLMALTDIDFSKHHYSVVVCRNGTAQPGGWAEGGNYTYKFDLTQGTAPKGTFFYVGGASKVIDGYAEPGFSTDISHANWIRTITINDGKDDVTGDGFGNATSSFIQNMNGGGGSADGIAVFDGTDVTTHSVPLDAVFYNPPINNAYSPPAGYLVPDNEFYNQKDSLGNPQPLFGEGSNTFTVPKPDSSSLSDLFCTMGGEVSVNGWSVIRQPQWKALNQNSQLSDIESGSGVTVYVK